MGRVFANGPGDRGLIPGRVIQKTLKKMVLDVSYYIFVSRAGVTYTSHYRVRHYSMNSHEQKNHITDYRLYAKFALSHISLNFKKRISQVN